VHGAHPALAVNMEELTSHPVNQQLSRDDKLRLYRDMVRIRRFEQRTMRGYQQGKMGGFLHLYIGQEACAVGCVSVLGKEDHFITAYRDHGHAIACGMEMGSLMSELQGKGNGCSKGKGGSMHFFAPEKRFWGGHGIVGGQTPLGLGIAYALKYKGIKGACQCFLGDGAVNQGPYHESLNLAALWDIPVVYIIENNGYSMGTSQNRSSAYPDFLAKRAEGYNIKWDICNGNVVYDVRRKVDEACTYAREESRPYVLEIFTYRYYGHSVADANTEKYRTKSEIEDYKKNKDPITLFGNQLKDEDLADDDTLKEIDDEAKNEAQEAADYADKSDFPAPESITQDIYWEEDNRDGNTASQGRIVFE